MKKSSISIQLIANETGYGYSKVYEMLKTIKQFDGYANDEANENAVYDAGFAGGLREALMMQSRITNEHIDRAIGELP